MALTPKERADFDEIVLRLRMEDAEFGASRSRRRAVLLIVAGLVAAVLTGLGIGLLGRGVLGPILIAMPPVAAVIVVAWGVLRPRRRWH